MVIIKHHQGPLKVLMKKMRENEIIGIKYVHIRNIIFPETDSKICYMLSAKHI